MNCIITIQAQRVNKAGKPLIDALVPDISGYPIPLNLTDAQGQALQVGKTEYNAVLVQGALKPNKTGPALFDYYWQCASLEGVVNQVEMDKLAGQAIPQAPPPQIITPQSSASPQGHSQKDLEIMRQSNIKAAVELVRPFAERLWAFVAVTSAPAGEEIPYMIENYAVHGNNIEGLLSDMTMNITDRLMEYTINGPRIPDVDVERDDPPIE